MVMRLTLIIIIYLVSASLCQHDPHYLENRSVIVHLFEWKFKDIANECEIFLAPNGYGGVQVSPVNENVVIENRPWWERYQPMSYLVATRSGNEDDFRDMVKRCNSVGIRIYVDVLLNHMASQHDPEIGTSGSTADVPTKYFPAVPYTAADFHATCAISNYKDPIQVRNCELNGLKDLDQSKPNVQTRQLEFLNHLLEMGVAGFRIDAAKHMWPKDLNTIYNKINNLSTTFGFPGNSRPFIYQEVIDLGGEPIKKTEYNGMGVVTEFRFSAEIGKAFRGSNLLKWLKTWGPDWEFLPSKDALVFVDNHDNQRGHGAGGADVLTFKMPKAYKMAAAFMLAHPYGIPRVMSSYNFTNTDQGPPADKNFNTLSPTFNADNRCGNGWICEHRWNEISNMVGFHNMVKGTELSNWWDNGGNQIAFCRGNKGFVAFNNDNIDNTVTLNTCLPPGEYCDIFSGKNIDNKCSAQSISVSKDGKAVIKLPGQTGAVAFHVGAKL